MDSIPIPDPSLPLPRTQADPPCPPLLPHTESGRGGLVERGRQMHEGGMEGARLWPWDTSIPPPPGSRGHVGSPACKMPSEAEARQSGPRGCVWREPQSHSRPAASWLQPGHPVSSGDTVLHPEVSPSPWTPITNHKVFIYISKGSDYSLNGSSFL